MRLSNPNKQKISINDIKDQSELDEKRRKRKKWYQERKKSSTNPNTQSLVTPTQPNTEVIKPLENVMDINYLFFKPPSTKFVFPWKGGDWNFEEECKEIMSMLQNNNDFTIIEIE